MISSQSKKIVLTGGHAGSTAYAFVKHLQSRYSWKLYFVGSTTAIEGKKVPTLESLTMPTLGVQYLPLVAGRLQLKLSFWGIISLFKLPIGMLQALWLMIKIKPNAILSFGGYVAFPVVLAGKILRIPVLAHEQTAVIGRANLYSLPFVDLLAISRASTSEYLPKSFDPTKIHLTGNPVNADLITAVKRHKSETHAKPKLFVHGGSRGSLFINNLLKNTLHDLLPNWQIHHQTGKDNYQDFVALKKTLPANISSNYILDPFLIADSWVKSLVESDLVVGRSGANICSELLVIQKPALLIPLPFSYLNEQLVNARALQKMGGAEVLQQNDATPKMFLQMVDSMGKKLPQYQRNYAKNSQLDIYASEKLLNLLVSLMEKK